MSSHHYVEAYEHSDRLLTEKFHSLDHIQMAFLRHDYILVFLICFDQKTLRHIYWIRIVSLLCECAYGFLNGFSEKRFCFMSHM